MEMNVCMFHVDGCWRQEWAELNAIMYDDDDEEENGGKTKDKRHTQFILIEWQMNNRKIMRNI